MDHIAILKDKIFLEKILSGEKLIESRWYNRRVQPWDNLYPNDTIYFKLSGKPVTAKADVGRILQFGDLNPFRVHEIFLSHYKNLDDDYDEVKNKKYCILVFLKNPGRVEPFDIDKKGYGTGVAWLYVNNINEVKVRK